MASKKRSAKKSTHASMKKSTKAVVKGFMGGANRTGGNRPARGTSYRAGKKS